MSNVLELVRQKIGKPSVVDTSRPLITQGPTVQEKPDLTKKVQIAPPTPSTPSTGSNALQLVREKLNTSNIDVAPRPSGVAKTTPQTSDFGTLDNVSEILDIPEKLYGAITEAPARIAAEGLRRLPKGSVKIGDTEITFDPTEADKFASRPIRGFGEQVEEAIGSSGLPGAKKAAPFLAFGAMFAEPDFMIGKAGKIDDAAKLIAKTTNADEIVKVIKGIYPKIPDDVAKTMSLTMSKIDDVAEVTKKLSSFAKAVPKAADDVVKTAARERAFVTSAKQVLPDAPKIAGQYVPRSTDALAIKAKNLIIESIEDAEHIALTRSDDSAVAIASELLKHYADEAVNATSDATRFALYEKAADIANTLAPKLTEQGRAIQAASILGRLTPEGQIRFAAKEILRWNAENPSRMIPELTAKQAGDIYEEMLTITRMADGEEKAIRFKKLQDMIRNLVPSTVMDKVTSIWKAGLLTGIKTTGLNMFANISHTATEVAKDVPASMADFVMSLATGKRTLKATMRGTGEGMQEGIKRGWRYFKTGYDVRDIGVKLDYRQVNFKNKILQGYVDTVFRLLGTQDQPFYYGALKRSLYNQALVKASNEGVGGAAKLPFVRNLIENPTDDMLKYAVLDAETAVFQNKTALGKIARGVQKLAGGAGEFVVPFGRTPSAVAMQVINYSPAGAFIEIGKQIARGTFDQRLLAQAIGRSSIGTGVMWVGKQLYEKGMMTLDYPKDERERELWKAEGKKPNAIKIGNDWRTVQTLGPAGPVMLIGGHLSSAFKETGSASSAMIQAIGGTLKSFTEQTFLKGVNDVMAAITDPAREAKGAVSSFVSSVIPTIVNDVARATDPKERRTADTDFAKEVLNRVQSRMPGLRQGLEPQVTVLGEELARIGNPLEVMADPTRPSEATPTPVNQELRRLMDAGFKVSPTLLGDRVGYKGLTPKQNTELWKKAGQITNDKLGSLFSKEAYQKLSDEEKAEIVEKVVDQSKLNARAGMVLELTQGLSGEDLKKKLSELKAGGLLTKEVLKKWQELR